MTAKDVARLLKISLRSAYALKHDIGYVQIGGRVRFTKDDVDQFVSGCRVARKRPAPQVCVTRKLWLLGDMNVFRGWFARQLVENKGRAPGQHKDNHDNSSHFRAFRVADMPVGFVVARSDAA